MAKPYINTPQTNNDATYLTNGLDRIHDLSPEKSFFAPSQKQDLITQMRNTRNDGANLRTPRAGSRDPLRLLPNGNAAKGEFTPLMKSVAKNNIARRMSSRKAGGVETPGYLKNGYVGGGTPALPRMDENSHLHEGNESSSALDRSNFTPLPHDLSSSAHSTPLAQLPNRNGGAVVNDGNMMTLREQEGIIDKIEKENFGLKMKIHFLEDAMSKRGGEFNQAALKENTDLKVTKITMQRELHKFKKNIAQAERDAEVYRLRLEEYREQIKRRQADETTRLEMERLQNELQKKDELIEKLEDQSESSKARETAEIKRLRDDLEDAQADLRQKEREVEEREDEIDNLKMNASKESNSVAELEDELETAKHQIEDLQQDLEKAERDSKDAKDEREDALIEKRKAESDLEELQDEMANKSFTTKGLSRQLEKKMEKLEDDLEALQQRFDKTQLDLDAKTQSERHLQEKVRELEKEGASDARTLQYDLELAQQQRETAERKLNNATKQVESLEKELQDLSDEKNLLQSRHDALTTESAQLQKDLTQARKSIPELQDSLDQERRQATQQNSILRAQHQQDVDLLNDQIDKLHREVNSKENDHAADLEEWEAKRKSLESTSQKAEERASGLQRTVDKLHDSQGTLSGNEMKLQEALESEKQRHLQEEKILSKQIDELNEDLATKRSTAESNRLEVNNAKEELRISIREQAVLKEKISELEEEIEVLQADMDQEHQLLEQFQKKSHDSVDAQVTKLKKEKQTLQDNLANAQIDLSNVRRELSAAQADYEELEAKMQKSSKSPNDTFNVDTEKRDLKRAKQKLEKEVERLSAEKDALVESNRSLEDEINAEIDRAANEEDRLNKQLDQLKIQRLGDSDSKDKELKSAKNKASRLESRVKELEELLDDQSKMVSPGIDVSGLRNDLADARKNETAAAKRETDLKTTNRDLRMQVNDLERDLHDARLASLKSPSVSPPPSNSKELARLRQELTAAQTDLREAQNRVKELERSSRRASTTDAEQTSSLQQQLKLSAAEVKELNSKIAQQESLIEDLQSELQHLQSQQQETRNISQNLRTRERKIKDLETKLARLETTTAHPDAANTNAGDLSLLLSTQSHELAQTKSALTRIRSERRSAIAQATQLETELETLQSRYENMLERLSSAKHSSSQAANQIREKETRGLLKEISFLKARCKRAERLRKDAGWAKEFVKREEEVRRKCNEIDLRILREMGVEVPPRQKYERKLTPRNKFRAGVFTVIAAMRLSDLQEEWGVWKGVGEELKARQVGKGERKGEKEREREKGMGKDEARRVRIREV